MKKCWLLIRAEGNRVVGVGQPKIPRRNFLVIIPGNLQRKFLGVGQHAAQPVAAHAVGVNGRPALQAENQVDSGNSAWYNSTAPGQRCAGWWVPSGGHCCIRNRRRCPNVRVHTSPILPCRGSGPDTGSLPPQRNPARVVKTGWLPGTAKLAAVSLSLE